MMNIEITPIDFLTDAQKKQIGKAVFEKIMSQIEAIKTKPSLLDIDIGKEISEDINAMFENGDVYDYIDKNKIGKALSDLILSGLKP